MGDILIHIDKSLDQQAQTKLENQLLHQEGVRTAAISQSAQHLMLVDFDHQKTNSLNNFTYSEKQRLSGGTGRPLTKNSCKADGLCLTF